MKDRMTLAAGVMAAFSLPALFAQSQTQPRRYCYNPADCKAMKNAPPTPQATLMPEQPSQPIPIPDVLHFCAQHCVTFTREADGTLVNRTNLLGQSNMKRVLRFEKFTPESVIIHRTDSGSHPGDGMMRGRMQYGNSTATDGNWIISWGASIDIVPESDFARAQREGIPVNPQMQVSPFALLLGVLAGANGSAGADSGGSDLAGRISSLQDQLAKAKDDCFRSTVRSGSPGSTSACDRKSTLEYQLSDARAELRDEIDGLTEAHNRLAADCGAGNNDACEKQKQVDAQLARDKKFQVGSIFR